LKDFVKVTIFLASSADVIAERNIVQRTLEGIASDPQYRQWFKFDLRRWDDEHHPVPFTSGMDMQASINHYKGQSSEADLVIALYKHRFGSELAEDRFGISPDEQLYTGTQWEVLQALKANTELLIFRSEEHLAINPARTIAQQDDDYAQYQRVRKFFESDGYGLMRGGANWYKNAESFESRFSAYFKEWIAKRRQVTFAAGLPSSGKVKAKTSPRLNADQTYLHQLLLRDDIVSSKALLQRVKVSEVHTIEAYLLQRYAALALQEGDTLQRHFINLDLVTDLGAGIEGNNRYEMTHFKDLPELLSADPSAEAWLIVGDPGGGKSTLMQHYEMTRAVVTLRALDDSKLLERRPELAIWQRLAEYRPRLSYDKSNGGMNIEPMPGVWLASKWQERYPNLPSIAKLNSRFRIQWLLDGLNEIHCTTEVARHETLLSWSNWLRSPSSTGTSLSSPPIISVRRRDLTTGFGKDTRQAIVSEWTPVQIRDYCFQRLGPQNHLWPAIEKDAALRELSGNPFQLAAQCELFTALGRPVANRVELMSGIAWLRLRRAHVRNELDAEELLSRRDKIELSDAVRWKQKEYLVQLPDEGVLVRSLDTEALVMHKATGGTALSVPSSQVGKSLCGGKKKLREAWLLASESLGLAEVGREFRFSHHLWQEFFAARGMRSKGLVLNWLELLPPDLKPLREVINQLGSLDPLPGPGTTPWEESFKMAVLLSNQPQVLIEAALPLNLPLACRAAVGVLHHLTADLLVTMKKRLLDLLRDGNVDLRLRVEAGEALGQLGDDLRYERIISKTGATIILPKTTNWLRISNQSYAVDGSTDASNNLSSEKKRRNVSLSAFEVSFAPVTNAEFECFIRDGGYEQKSWWDWQGKSAMQFLQQGLRNTARERLLRKQRAEMRADYAGAMRERPFATLQQQASHYRLLRDESDFEFELRVERECAARKPSYPASWDRSNFNQPLQPVVGVSLFEARAFASWLGAQLPEFTYRLPNEFEWEVAAHGVVSPIHSGVESEQTKFLECNCNESRLRRTSPVGCFPKTDVKVFDSDQVLVDVAGNVWEWTSSLYRPGANAFELNALEWSGDVDSEVTVRGGSWDLHSEFSLPWYRAKRGPLVRSSALGFRVVRHLKG
jgi:formylglycine-generating enzyme required for sulfatase activity